MKVLKNNYNNVTNIVTETPDTYPRTHICEMCRSELEYDKSDIRMGAFGCMYVDCPCCGHDNMLEDNEYNITLTADNIEFPTHFWHICVENGAVDNCNNDEIKEWIQKGIEYFRENKNEFSWYCQSGTLCVEIKRWTGDEMYEVIVTNNYYSVEIPFEGEDYYH